MRFKLGSVQNSAIKEDSEQSEIENPYFSDNSSSSQLTSKLRKMSLEFSKMVDKSENDSSVLSGGGRKNTSLKSGGKQWERSHYHSNLNEPIVEVEDEKEEMQGKKMISESIQRRRKATRHIDHMLTSQRITTNRNMFFESDPITEENEIDDDELFSENNFYQEWENHKRYLLTQDE